MFRIFSMSFAAATAESRQPARAGLLMQALGKAGARRAPAKAASTPPSLEMQQAAGDVRRMVSAQLQAGRVAACLARPPGA